MKALTLLALLLLAVTLSNCASTAPNDNPPPRFEYDDDP
jgi:Spy/CpxP family protein refolding chaperone